MNIYEEEFSNFSNPETKKTGNDLQQLLKWLRTTEISLPERQYREQSQEDYRFYAGNQDSVNVRLELEKQRRPALVFNEIKPKIDMLIGLAAQTKHDVELLPVTTEDAPLSQLMTGVLKHYRKQLKISRKELECFEHEVKSGRSYLYFWVDRSDPFKPQIKAKRIPGWQVWVDPNSIEYDLSDARFVFVDKWLTKEEIKEYWPEMDFQASRDAAGWWPGQEHTVRDISSNYPTFFNENRDLWRICECWYRKSVNYINFVNPLNGQPASMNEEDFGKFKSLLKKGIDIGGGNVQQLEIGQTVRTKKKEIHYSIFSGNQEYEGGKSPYKFDDFPISLFGAYKDDDLNSWFGVVTMMKDPQRSVNTMRRQLQHLLQTLPKGMLIHEAGAILNIEEYEMKSSEPSFHLEVMQGALEKVKFEKQPQISPVYQDFDIRATQAMKDASGIQNELLGVQTTSREPGVSVRMRQETGLAVLYTLFDNYRESRERASRILLNLIQQYVDYPTVVRIQGSEGEQLVQINTQMNPQIEGYNDITATEFDLVFQDTAETATGRMGIAQMLVEYSQNNPGMIPPDVILEYSDIPFTVQQRVKQYYEQQMKAQQEAKEQEVELERMKIEASIGAEAIKSHTAKHVAKVKAISDARKKKEQSKEKK